MAEQDRIFSQGTAKRESPLLRQTSGGAYLKLLLSGLKAARENDWYTDHGAKIVAVDRGAYSVSKLTLISCEDYRAVSLIYPHGRRVRPSGTRLYVQTLTLKKSKDLWKIDDLQSHQISGSSKVRPC